MDLKNKYVLSMLGQRELPAMPSKKNESVAEGLLRADSMWANGDADGVLTAVAEQEEKPEWDSAEKWHMAYAAGLKALASGDLDAAYDAYVLAITAKRAEGDTEVIDVFAAERAVNVAFWLACSGTCVVNF